MERGCGRTTGGDDPWHFGGSTQYPVLQYRRGPLDIARQFTPVPTAADYDLDNDNLIDVVNLAQLNAIRHDLNGDGAGMTDSGAAAYLAGYPGYTTSMGCPGTCNGYELRANLNFDTNGDGMVNASDEIADFRPIGGRYAATFQGNGRTISNMRLTGSEGIKGLFAETTAASKISAVGLIDPVLSDGADLRKAPAPWWALTGAGFYGSYVRGGAVRVGAGGESAYIGGLVGLERGAQPEHHHARPDLRQLLHRRVSNGNREDTRAGGLAGINQYGDIVASYAAGAVTGSGNLAEFGCLVGRNSLAASLL